jgi:hypothetical protein
MTETRSVSGNLISITTRALLRVVLAFEPLASTAITVLINQRLNRYKEGKIIVDYKTHTKRLGKYHYRIEVDLQVTGFQAMHLLVNLFPKQLSRFRRWFHD